MNGIDRSDEFKRSGRSLVTDRSAGWTVQELVIFAADEVDAHDAVVDAFPDTRVVGIEHLVEGVYAISVKSSTEVGIAIRAWATARRDEELGTPDTSIPRIARAWS